MARGKSPTSYSLSARAKKILDRLSIHYGLNKTATLEFIIREHARSVGMMDATPGKLEGDS